MIEKSAIRDGLKIVQVRSDSGRLLFIKTKDGYEIKCPRSKEIYLVPYESMIVDYLTQWDEKLYKRKESGQRSEIRSPKPTKQGGKKKVLLLG